MRKAGATTIPSVPYSSSTLWSLALVCLFIGAATLFATFYEKDDYLLIGGVGTAFLLCGLGMLVRRKCVINWTQSMVVLEYKLFGKYTMCCKQILFSELDRILINRHKSSENPICYVSLRKRSGGKVNLRYFDTVEGRVCHEAQDFAERLASDLGLEIKDCQ